MDHPCAEAASASPTAFRGQSWDTAAYAATGRFVANLAGGVVELLAPQPGEAILDLGCGDGALTEKIAATGAVVTGADASPTMVAAARARGLNVYEVSGSAMAFDGQFDAVFSNAALHWMPDAEAVLAAVHRALKPGGRFVAEMGGMGNIAAIRTALQAVLAQFGIDAETVAQSFYPSPAHYRRLLEATGFSVRSIDLIPRPTPLPAGMVSWLNTFRNGVLDLLATEDRARALTETVALLQPMLCDADGNWTADYVRLRFAAVRG
jgi:trans-aconitate methyltransferase